jgi:hypothetical protein
MADTIRLAQYFKMKTSNKAGKGASVLASLRDAKVNLLAFSGFPLKRRAQLDFVPSNPAAFKTAARKAKLKVRGPKTCFLVEGDDRPGAGARLMARLADAKINVTSLQAISAGGGRYGAILWVKPRDVRKAAKALGIG